MTRSRLERLFSGPVPEDDQPVTTETQAVDAMRLATDNTALKIEIADMAVRLRHAEHELDELRVALDLAEKENKKLRLVANHHEAHCLGDVLGDYRRMVEQDKTDQPPEDELLQLCAGCHANWIPRDPTHELCEDCDPNGRPDLTVWVDVVEPSKNGTT